LIGSIFILLLIFSVVLFFIWRWFFDANKEPVENFYKLAQNAFESGDYKKAKDLFLKIKKIDSNMDAKYKLGITFLKLSEYQNAQECFEKVLKKQPQNIDVLSALAKVFRLKGDYNEAVNIYTKIVEKDSKNPEGLLNISQVYYEQNDYFKALEVLEKAKEKFSDNSNILFSIIKCNSKMKDMENDTECKEILEEYIKLSERKDLPPEFYTEIAKTYAMSGDSDNALEACQKAIALNSEDIHAYQILGLIQLIHQDLENAKTNLTIALNIQPSNKETHNVFSYLLCHQVDDCPLDKCRENYFELIKKHLK
jgi:tetratricopeptide (TPR) repeat protein